MEYSLTNKKFVILILFISLNPCFNGILSDKEIMKTNKFLAVSLSLF